MAANFFYDINTKSGGRVLGAGFGGPVTSGNALYGDFHALYKLGKWSFGPVGYFEEQTTPDSGCPTPAVCGMLSNVAVGGLVGYDFGPVDLQMWVTDSVSRQQRDRRSELLVALGLQDLGTGSSEAARREELSTS